MSRIAKLAMLFIALHELPPRTHWFGAMIEAGSRQYTPGDMNDLLARSVHDQLSLATTQSEMVCLGTLSYTS